MTQRLDEEIIQKRREKAEKWRQSRKPLEGEEIEIKLANENENKKSWTLDDDDLDADEAENTDADTQSIPLETEEERPIEGHRCFFFTKSEAGRFFQNFHVGVCNRC